MFGKGKEGGSYVAGFLLCLFLNFIGLIIAFATGQPKTKKGAGIFFLVLAVIALVTLIVDLFQ